MLLIWVEVPDRIGKAGNCAFEEAPHKNQKALVARLR